jgi:hypothetical protein
MRLHALLLLLLPGPAVGQTTSDSARLAAMRRLEPMVVVQIEVDGRRIGGRFLRVDSSHLALDLRTGRDYIVPVSRVARLWDRETFVASRAPEMAVGGALGGALIGYQYGHAFCGPRCKPKSFDHAVLGALIGAGIGAARGSRELQAGARWRQLWP